MNELTAGEIWRIHEKLERDAAYALGRTIFAFSSLDVNLGLMVASALRQLGNIGKAVRVDSLSFKARLDFVENYVATNSEIDPKAVSEIKVWVSQAHTARLQRNQLIHGRWVVDPFRGKALNIVGIPSSDAQQTIEYTIEELGAIGQDFQ